MNMRPRSLRDLSEKPLAKTQRRKVRRANFLTGLQDFEDLQNRLTRRGVPRRVRRPSDSRRTFASLRLCERLSDYFDFDVLFVEVLAGGSTGAGGTGTEFVAAIAGATLGVSVAAFIFVPRSLSVR